MSVKLTGSTSLKSEIGEISSQPKYSSYRLRSRTHLLYKTKRGKMFNGPSEDILQSYYFRKYYGKVNLILTSPPFPLNRKKRYGNYNGEEYKKWLSGFANLFRKLLTADGSIVIEIGNAWTPGSPEMATLGLESLISLRQEGDFKLCQQFVSYNRARLPGPAQWVTVKRVRVKDSYTNIWWMAKNANPKADNRRVLKPYSSSMVELLNTGKYNSGYRPSEHHVGERSFLKNNGGAIPGNVLEISNTRSTDQYIKYCKETRNPLHPARMSEVIPDFFIRFLTEPGDLVLDPFAGSNVTGASAERLGRYWISIERDPIYAQTSHSRFSRNVLTWFPKEEISSTRRGRADSK